METFLSWKLTPKQEKKEKNNVCTELVCKRPVPAQRRNNHSRHQLGKICGAVNNDYLGGFLLQHLHLSVAQRVLCIFEIIVIYTAARFLVWRAQFLPHHMNHAREHTNSVVHTKPMTSTLCLVLGPKCDTVLNHIKSLVLELKITIKFDA